MSSRLPFFATLKVQDKELPPYHIFPFVEFVFKIVQWSGFVALLSFTAHRVASEHLAQVAGLLKTAIICVIDERLARELWGRIKFNKDAHPILVGLSIIVIVAVGTYAGYRLNLEFEGVITELVASYTKP